MSKNSPVEVKNANKNSQMEKIPSAAPTIRDVRPLDTLRDENSSSVIAVYKDLNEASKPMSLNSTQHLFIAFAVFVMLGVGILMGTQMNQRRQIASTFGASVPAGAVVQEEHYHYDKTCHKNEKGEKVCLTRTSQK